jgi:hypothetical protein
MGRGISSTGIPLQDEVRIRLGGLPLPRGRWLAAIRPQTDPAVRHLIDRSNTLVGELCSGLTLGPSQPTLLAALIGMYTETPAVIERRLSDFVGQQGPLISAAIRGLSRRLEARWLVTPETLMVLERLENARSTLIARWPDSIPRRDLELIAELSGQPLG